MRRKSWCRGLDRPWPCSPCPLPWVPRVILPTVSHLEEKQSESRDGNHLWVCFMASNPINYPGMEITWWGQLNPLRSFDPRVWSHLLNFLLHVEKVLQYKWNLLFVKICSWHVHFFLFWCMLKMFSRCKTISFSPSTSSPKLNLCLSRAD